MQDFDVLMDFYNHLKTRPQHNEVTQEGYRQLERDFRQLTEEMTSTQLVLEHLDAELDEAHDRIARAGL